MPLAGTTECARHGVTPAGEACARHGGEIPPGVLDMGVRPMGRGVRHRGEILRGRRVLGTERRPCVGHWNPSRLVAGERPSSVVGSWRVPRTLLLQRSRSPRSQGLGVASLCHKNLWVPGVCLASCRPGIPTGSLSNCGHTSHQRSLTATDLLLASCLPAHRAGVPGLLT